MKIKYRIIDNMFAGRIYHGFRIGQTVTMTGQASIFGFETKHECVRGWIFKKHGWVISRHLEPIEP